MSKAQWGILGAMLLVAIINLEANPATASFYWNPALAGQALKTVSPAFWGYWVAGLVALLILADVLPQAAVWIAVLLVTGAVLYRGPEVLKNKGGTSG
jgi:hypothetical protein